MDSEVDQMTENTETPKVPEDGPIPTGPAEGECPRAVPTAPAGSFSGAHPAPPGSDSSSQPPLAGQPAPQAQVPPSSPWTPNPSAAPWQPQHVHAPGYGAPVGHGATTGYGAPAGYGTSTPHQWPGSTDSQVPPGAGGQGHWGPPPAWPPPPAMGSGAMGQWPGSPQQQPRRRARGALVTVLVFCLGVTGLLGALVGHAVWQSTTTSTTGLQSTGTPFKTSNSGNGGTGSSSPGASAASIASKVDPGLVDINTTLSYESIAGAGTGMVLTSDGLILTNNHVIEGATAISVVDIGNGKTYQATVLGYDRTKDIALLQLTNASGLATVTLSTSTASTGDQVVAIGNAGGTGGTPSAAAGSITATDQSITASDEATGSSEELTGLLETNANIVPGDSGGPLVNRSGDVLAMDTAAAQGYSFSSQGTQGYSIPIATAESIVRSIESGSASTSVHIGATAFLGVQVESASDGGSATSGAYIASVVSGEPAANAGLQEGDTITSLAGTSVSTPEALTTVMASEKPGASVQVQYINTSGTAQSTTVELGSGPPQ
jgi:S1-C subfamily serine protease